MSGCAKVRYETRQEAEAALLRARVQASLHLGRYHQKRHECRAYLHNECRGFHLTSQPLRQVTA